VRERLQPASAPGAPPGPDLRDYLAILIARKWPFLGTASATVFLVTLVTFATRPVYRATSLLLIEPRSMNVAKVEGVYDPIVSGMAMIDYYKTQFEILKSRRIVDPVVDQLGVRARGEFRDERDPVEAFKDTITVEPVRESRLVRVSVDSPDREFATTAANAIVEQFVDENNQRTLGVSDKGLQKLKEMERSLRPKYEAAARALQEFKDANNIYFLDETQSVAVQELKALSDELTKARAAHARAAAEKETFDGLMAEGQPTGPLPEFVPSRALDDLKVDLARVEQERDDLLKHYTPEHPAVQAAQARVARAQERLTEESSALVRTVEKRLGAETLRLEQLESAVTKAERKVTELGRKAVRLQFLKEESDTVAASYKNVARRIEEVEVAIATGTKENNLFVIDAALVPEFPYKPRKVVNLSLGLAVGLLLGALMAFLLDQLDQTIKTKDEAERLLRYPVLGYVPRAERELVPDAAERRSGRALELVAQTQSRGAVAESFRTIRTGLGFTLPATGPKALLVTSSSPGDGKTFVSVNLALSLAQTGKRVLLVDADLRRPRLHDIFDVPQGEAGLSTALADGESPLAAVQATLVPHLDLLTSGPLPPNPAELLGSRCVEAFVASVLREYDWLIFDSPPVTAVADPAILLAHVPHAILVLRSYATIRGAALRAKEVLDWTPGRVCGVVLNTADVPSSTAGYHYGGYGPYYAAEGARRPRARTAVSQPESPAER
jgi:capsular exopolysaccharide synthesis family protein